MDHDSLSGNLVDLVQRRIFPGTIQVSNGRISSIQEHPVMEGQFILPGFIDAHIHIESSMLAPSEFARLAVLHGTVATVSDPHEIGNVLGIEGVRFMRANSEKVPFHIFFGAPSCVPATSFETAGATLTADDIRSLLEQDNLKYLSEMMNYPGVLNRDAEVLEKIRIAQALNKPVDGHAPGLRGDQAKAYIAAGISTDHECFTLEEALDKVRYGMKILIREGSAAKNFNALHPLIQSHPDKVMFCSDDKHPNELLEGHINVLVRRAIGLGYDAIDVLRAACLHPIEHYGLEVGRLQPGDPADFIVVDNLKDFRVKATYLSGKLAALNGKSLIERVPIDVINRFNCSPKHEGDFQIQAEGPRIHVIQIHPGELTTGKLTAEARIEAGHYVSDVPRDILKLVVVNRYADVPPSIAFVNGLGLQKGALASSVAHDSHNIIAAGVDDFSICRAVNAVIAAQGGLAVVDGKEVDVLPLPIAGLMSDQEGGRVGRDYAAIKEKSLNLGSKLPDPFMALSFLALLVIPSLKLSDRGLFDAEAFKFIPLASR